MRKKRSEIFVPRASPVTVCSIKYQPATKEPMQSGQWNINTEAILGTSHRTCLQHNGSIDKNLYGVAYHN